MVKKLFKHECIYYIRSLAIFLPWVLFLGILTRITRELDNGSTFSALARGSSTVVFIFATFAIVIFSLFLGIIRFYKNMYSAEGYLTFSLPITNLQHMIVKLTVASLALLASLVTVALSVVIAFWGEAFQYLLLPVIGLYQTASLFEAILVTLEWVVALLLFLASAFLLFYACISIGQLAKKNKILLSIGVYYINNIITEVLTTILLILFGIFSSSDLFAAFDTWLETNPFAIFHIFPLVIIILSAGLSLIYFLITYRIMNKKLNLE